MVVSSDDLGKVPFGALSVSNERSVSARLESLESCVSKVTSAMEKMSAKFGPSVVQSQPPVNVPIPMVPAPRVILTAATDQQNMTPPNPDWASVASGGAGGGSMAAALAAGRGRGGPGRTDQVRERSASDKRKKPGEDEEGFKPQGRPRKTAGGSSKVVLDELGEVQPHLQYYISNTPGHATPELIKKVLEKCSAPLLKDQAILTVHKVECLTKEEDARTRCWKVAVPFKFKDVMENNELYPEGWRHRTFFGGRPKQQPNKQPRLEDTRLKEAEQELERERLDLQQKERIARQTQSGNIQEQHVTAESTVDCMEDGGGLSESSKQTDLQ